MLASITALRVDDSIERSPSFTLATALVLLGHDCTGACPLLATECRCSVWVVRLADATGSGGTPTVVEVTFRDPPWAVARTAALIAAVNCCVRADRLRVRVPSHDGGSGEPAGL